jgi:hypothetical protein
MASHEERVELAHEITELAREMALHTHAADGTCE